MTLTLLELAGSHAAVLALGYLAGRRAIRRRLQTTEGRLRLGGARLLTEPQPVTELPTTEFRRLPSGEPTQPTYAIPAPR